MKTKMNHTGTKNYHGQKNAFLTEIDYNAKKAKKRVNMTHSIGNNYKGRNEKKLPYLSKKGKNGQEPPYPQINDLNDYVEHFKHDVRRFNSINKKSDPMLKKTNFADFNSNFAFNFLENQKKRIEDEIQQIYTTKQPKELEDIIKTIETKHSFKEILQLKEQELIQSKKIFNQYDYKLKQIKGKIKKTDVLLEKYDTPEKENDNNAIQLNEKKHENMKEKLDEVIYEKECLDNLRNTYKSNILILKKRSSNLKDDLKKLKNKFETKNNEIIREEAIQNDIYKRVLDHKKNKKVKYNDELINQKIKDEYNFYEDQIKFDQIMANEEKINQAKQQTIYEDKQKEKEREKEEMMNTLEEKKLQIMSLRDDLKKYEDKLESLQKHIHVKEESQIVAKIYEHRSSKEALNELKKGYSIDINKLKDEINFLRKTLELSLFNEAENLGNTKKTENEEEDMNRSGLQENILFENKLLKLDDLVKEKNTDLFNKTLAFRQLNQIILDSSSTVSRILYQLDPALSKKTQISHQNIIDLLTFAGLQLEKILNYMYIEGNLNNRNLYFNNSFSIERENEARNQPPSWLRINTEVGSQNNKKESKGVIKTSVKDNSNNNS